VSPDIYQVPTLRQAPQEFSRPIVAQPPFVLYNLVVNWHEIVGFVYSVGQNEAARNIVAVGLGHIVALWAIDSSHRTGTLSRRSFLKTLAVAIASASPLVPLLNSCDTEGQVAPPSTSTVPPMESPTSPAATSTPEPPNTEVAPTVEPTKIPTMSAPEIFNALTFAELNQQVSANRRFEADLAKNSATDQAELRKILATDQDPQADQILAEIQNSADRIQSDTQNSLIASKLVVSLSGGGWALEVVDTRAGNSWPVWTTKVDNGLSSRPDGAENDTPIGGGYRVPPDFDPQILVPRVHVQAVNYNGKTLGFHLMVLADKQTGRIAAKLDVNSFQWVKDLEYKPTPTPPPEDARSTATQLGIEESYETKDALGSVTEALYLGDSFVYIDSNGQETSSKESASFIYRKNLSLIGAMEMTSYGARVAEKTDLGWQQADKSDTEIIYGHLVPTSDKIIAFQRGEISPTSQLIGFGARSSGEMRLVQEFDSNLDRVVNKVYLLVLFRDGEGVLKKLWVQSDVFEPGNNVVLRTSQKADGTTGCDTDPNGVFCNDVVGTLYVNQNYLREMYENAGLPMWIYVASKRPNYPPEEKTGSGNNLTRIAAYYVWRNTVSRIQSFVDQMMWGRGVTFKDDFLLPANSVSLMFPSDDLLRKELTKAGH